MRDAQRPKGEHQDGASHKWQDCHERRTAPIRVSTRDGASHKMAGLSWEAHSAHKGEHQGWCESNNIELLKICGGLTDKV